MLTADFFHIGLKWWLSEAQATLIEHYLSACWMPFSSFLAWLKQTCMVNDLLRSDEHYRNGKISRTDRGLLPNSEGWVSKATVSGHPHLHDFNDFTDLTKAWRCRINLTLLTTWIQSWAWIRKQISCHKLCKETRVKKVHRFPALWGQGNEDSFALFGKNLTTDKGQVPENDPRAAGQSLCLSHVDIVSSQLVNTFLEIM